MYVFESFIYAAKTKKQTKIELFVSFKFSKKVVQNVVTYGFDRLLPSNEE